MPSFITSPVLLTEMELYKMLCIHFDHKRGTEIVSSNTLQKPIFIVMNGILWRKMYNLY